MKNIKFLVLILVSYWLVKWTEINEFWFFVWRQERATVQEEQRATHEEILEFAREKKKDQKNKDFKLYRVEERTF